MQHKVYAVKRSINRLEESVRRGTNKTNRELRHKLRQLRDQERRLSEQAEDLYNELNVPPDFPGMNRYGREFLKTLIILNDTRRSVQQRVASRLFEYERIDQAAGGSGRRLGASIHAPCITFLRPSARLYSMQGRKNTSDC